ncbi:TetR family transcriptional regulator [Streptomyces venezuelae]|uniref:TetR/AcrR family transcriptional regulator n=1 Tax=Streptomyces gardneri TaxID=66892 RepID=UPI0006BD5CDC|nr:TetR/AcrR family transcriptional regulator [Streptomyces gardneri]ALO11758.1 TetR family transcriptional regulator [Streptomyces venezuelae]QPK48624.1 TetR/AcrR family transcriptional regulator [Streptomyces gardneri]WRK40098.1 TetR/AcrR family transcriptional regulator [Streptomyces venezuelae]CUM37687.1 transcriptional regulator, TetR family [Streptomyces venezuelae]
MGRTSDARERILTAAKTLMLSRGYSALGVAEICKAAGVPKGSFYYFFASKEELALAVIDEHWTAQRTEWTRALDGEGDGGGDGAARALQGLRRLYEFTAAELRAGQRSCGSVTGCLLGNLALEMSTGTATVRERLREIFDEQVALVEETVAEAHGRGEVTVADAHEAARALVAQLEGQVLFAKLYDDAGRLDVLWPNSLSLLGARTPSTD